MLLERLPVNSSVRQFHPLQAASAFIRCEWSEAWTHQRRVAWPPSAVVLDVG